MTEYITKSQKRGRQLPGEVEGGGTHRGFAQADTANRLQQIAETVNQEHAEIEIALREGLARAVKVGELLTEAKALVKHGEWGGWIADNCPFSERTAQNYMRIYTRYPELATKAQRVADLPYREAVALLAEPTFPKFEVHELGNIFPIMQDREIDSLAKSIKADGLYMPIVLYEGRMLDGKCRYAACKRAGVLPKFQTFPDNFPGYRGGALDFVVSSNLHRAHYNETQRACMAVKLMETEP